MAISQTLRELRASLSRFSYPKYFMNAQQFEKEKLEKPMVLRTGVVRKISAEHFREVRNLPKDEIFKLCERLLKDGNGDLRDIAFD